MRTKLTKAARPMTDDIITPEVDSTRPQLTLGGELALVTSLKRWLEKREKELRAEYGGDLLDKHAIDGTLDVELRIGDYKVGKASVRQGKRRLQATDMQTALQWAYDNGFMIQSIDFDALERHTHEVNGALVTDDGVLVDGIEYVTGADYMVVTGCKDADIAAALAALPDGAGENPLALLEGGDEG